MRPPRRENESSPPNRPREAPVRFRCHTAGRPGGSSARSIDRRPGGQLPRRESRWWSGSGRAHRAATFRCCRRSGLDRCPRAFRASPGPDKSWRPPRRRGRTPQSAGPAFPTAFQPGYRCLQSDRRAEMACSIRAARS